jgi:uncharacterized membrane protein
VKAAITKALACGVALLAFCPITVTQAEPSAAACTDYARSYAQKETRGVVLAGAGVGSGVGGLVGSIFGKSGAGAIVGAGIGTIAGSKQRSQNSKAIFEDAFIDCMAGRVQ